MAAFRRAYPKAQGWLIGAEGLKLAHPTDWNPPAGTKGMFWIYAVATRSGATARTYATGPVRIGSAAPGNYQFGPTVGGPFSQINVGTPATVPAPNALALTAPRKTPKAKRTTATTATKK